MATIGPEGFAEGGEGSKGVYLAGAIAKNFRGASCNIPKLGVDKAKFDGGFDELIKECAALKEQTENKVKKCAVASPTPTPWKVATIVVLP